MTPSFNVQEAEFIESAGMLFDSVGFPPSIGRVLGVLLICEPVYQSAEEIRTRLGLSVGSVSTALTALQKMNLVMKVNFLGQRRQYYQLDPHCWQKIVQSRLRQIQQGVELSEMGLKVRPANRRLVAMRSLYAQFASAVESIHVS